MLADPTSDVAERRREAPPRWVRPVTSVAAGLLLAAAFPPRGWWPLAPVAVATLTLAVRERPWRRGVAGGLAFGLAFCFPLFEGLRPVGIDAWVALSLFE